jgi:DNA-binding IclR family transcriptional regulator
MVNVSDEISRYRAPALDKGLDILELLAEHEEGQSQAEIAKALGRSPSELYRMFDTLVRRGYLRRVATDDRLILGLKLFALSTRHPPMRRLLQAASEVTTEVAAETLQSCHLALYRDGNLFIAVQADSPGRLSLSVRLGAEVDLLTTGSGLAMLTFQSDERRARMLAAHGAAKLTPEMREAIEETAARGHIARPSAQTVGVTDLAFPIIGRTGDAVAVLAIPFIGRLDPRDAPSAEACQRILGRAAARLSGDIPGVISGEFDHTGAVA